MRHRSWLLIPLLILIILLIIAFNSAVHCRTQELKEKRPISQEQELKALDLSWHQAVADRDVVALGSLLADDYRLSADAARLFTKAQEIEAVKASDPLYDFGSFKLKDVTVMVEGGRATVSGILTVKPGSGDQNSLRRYFFTRTYLSRDGRWQALTSRLVTLSEGMR